MGKKIFISYDTSEVAWADFIKRLIESRLPARGSAFVAKLDIPFGSDPVDVMLRKNLLKANALVSICSRASRTSPWIWWEASATWARRKRVFPLFLGIDVKDFGGPISMLCQGCAFDTAGIDKLLGDLFRHLFHFRRAKPLTKNEKATFITLSQAVSQTPIVVDKDGPSCVQDDAFGHWRRIRVRNIGSRTVSGIETVLLSTSSGPPPPHDSSECM